MRRFIFTVILIILLVVCMDPAKNLLSQFHQLEQPLTHEIQKGEWLSKLAEKYYGDASYWKELSLINRAPDGNLIFPGEKVIIPSFESIQKIRKSRRLSTINELVGEQQDILAGKLKRPEEPMATIESREPIKSSQDLSQNVQKENQYPLFDDQERAFNDANSSSFISVALLIGVLSLGILLIGGIYFFIFKRNREEISYYGAPTKDTDAGKLELKKNIFLGDFAKEHQDKDSKTKLKEIEMN